MRTIVAIVFALVISTSAGAQDKELIDALKKLDARVFKADSADAKRRSDSLRKMRDNVNQRDVEAWRAIKTKDDWEKFRDERIAKLRASLGNFPDAPKQVKITTTKKLQGDGFSVECILYESRPNFYVSANLYVPADKSKSMPGFIVIHSHHNPKTQSELQDMGMTWARQGCLVLIPDMIGHGERRQHPFTNAKSYPEAFKVGRQDYYFRYNTNLQLSLIGDSLMGWMVWDLMRGVDVLYQRPNLDKTKVMVFGSVAGGGDPCAVFAALEPRITAAAPFNFGGPQPETKFPLPKDAELAFNYMGGGSWESTRGLSYSARDGALPWVIVGSLAPRGLIYGHEFAWDEARDPVWARFNKIWGDFYGAKDKLASAKGRGSVSGMAPESTHCNNIGPEHRKPMYPTLNRWFGLPIPEMEYKKRFDSSELQCWTDEARRTLKPEMLHEVARKIATARDKGVPLFPDLQERWLRVLGVAKLDPAKCKVDFVDRQNLPGNVGMVRFIMRHQDDPSIAVPLVTIRRTDIKDKMPGVICLAQGGKAGFLKYRAETIARLVKNGVAVCLPDLRGTGETSADGRGRGSGGTSYSATALMHGQTVAGFQLQELVLLMDQMRKDGETFALWGDSFADFNDATTNLAVPHDAGKMPRQSEPMGGLLALLGGEFGGANVKAIYTRGGLVSFRSMLDSPFCYFPHDAVIAGVVPSMDINSLMFANRKRPLRMEAPVDGLNRRVDQNVLDGLKLTAKGVPTMLREEPGSQAEVAGWLFENLRQ